MIKISFIGIDKKTNIERLLKIAEKYPEVEFGFLCSDSVTGTNQNNRYPPLILLQQLKNKNINLSLHVCGRLARTVCQTGNFDEVKKFVGAYFDMFDRIQLNVVGSRFKELITDTCGKQIVIQTNLSEHKSKETYEKFREANIDNIVFLSDNSGGKGLDVDFDYFEGLDYQGFAGGLKPENILEKKEEIDILWEKDYWLDMESGVRTDDWFDLDKVEDICKKVLGER